MWYDENAITNILSLHNLHRKGYKVDYDNSIDDTFKVTAPSGKKMVFLPSSEGLYYFDTRITGVNLLNTVEENKTYYSKAQVKRAELARATLFKIGLPSVRDFKHLIRYNLINNCPVTLKDVDLAERIFGPSIANLKGKTTRTRPTPVRQDIVSIPEALKEPHKDVTLDIDILFVNKIPFLMSVSHNIEFVTTQCLPNRKKITIA